MKALRNLSPSLALIVILSGACAASAQTPGTVLHAPEASKLLPDSVYFAGKSATTQLRNSAGIHYSDDHFVLAVLVDTSGYSSAIQDKYQGYLLTEVPLILIPVGPADRRLPPGAYGIGFVGDHFVVMDIGNHDVHSTRAMHDTQMEHPVPLQIMGPWQLQKDPHTLSGTYRLCFGRNCIDFKRAE